MKRPHFTKRTLLVLWGVLFIVGGAIINVAVAWGCATYGSNPKHSEGTELSNFDGAWRASVPSSWPTPVYHGERCALGRTLDYRSVDQHSTGFFQQSFRQAGLPLRALESECQFEALRPFEHSGHALVGLDDSRISYYQPVDARALPLRPIWPGFAINTIFYAAVLFAGRMLFAAPGFVRRRIRIMRGLCPACAYPVGVSDVCTECGTANSRLIMP